MFLLAVGGFWLWSAFSSDGLINQAVSFLEAHVRENAILAGGLFFGFATLSVLLGPFTSAPMVPVAVLLWGNGITFGLLFSGWVIGGMGAYAIGRFIGYPVVGRIVSREKVDAWREFVSRRMTFAWALLFRLAMPAETGYIFGLVRYRIGAYLLITALVEAPIAAVLVWASDALVARDFARFIGWIAAAIFVFAAAAYLLRERMRRSV
ncbi:MAG: hypothetical protein HY473_00555 [Candidatus Sungbacteria bacterium]|uniref:TVP38/TMEM64 family membrane protein n=1 Tax=Candidatus Sungiibacteriota bacterium TaxID=2750080 RepID=A0A932YYJ6_9BACT|nr:hypothetical protein [Candidatus Sungbacteria bacterium]